MKSCISTSARRGCATASMPPTANWITNLEPAGRPGASTAQSRGQVDGLAGVFAAQRAIVLPPQQQHQRRGFRDKADHEGRTCPDTHRIKIENEYRQAADCHIDIRQAFINRTCQAHGITSLRYVNPVAADKSAEFDLRPHRLSPMPLVRPSGAPDCRAADLPYQSLPTSNSEIRD